VRQNKNFKRNGVVTGLLFSVVGGLTLAYAVSQAPSSDSETNDEKKTSHFEEESANSQSEIKGFSVNDDDNDSDDNNNDDEKENKKKKKQKKKAKKEKKRRKKGKSKERSKKKKTEKQKKEEAKVESGAGATEGDVWSYKYVIVGLGTAGYSALKVLRESDPNAKILVVGYEPNTPYERPPLSKELWWTDDPDVGNKLEFTNYKGEKATPFYETPEELSKYPNVKVLTNMAVVDLDVDRKGLMLADGTIVFFEKCLLATGGHPRSLPNQLKHPKVTTFRTIQDFQMLDKVTRDPTIKHITIIGGGFLGTELAAALNKRGKQFGFKVAQVFPESGCMALNIPQYLSDYATKLMRNDGVDVRPGVFANEIKALENENKLELLLSDKTSIQTDHIVVAVGIKPNTGLAEKSNLEVDRENGGIVVNAELQARSDIYVAGDVASYYDAVLGRRRVEHYDHAQASGAHAAKNMLGARKPYTYQPFFWGNMNGIPYEAVGIIDSRLETVGVWQKGPQTEGGESTADYQNNNEFKRGVVYYLKNKKIVGVLLWNLFERVEDAQRAIKLGREFDDLNKLQRVISLEEKPPKSIEPPKETKPEGESTQRAEGAPSQQ
jgi:programmed cell death 8 (apoptosis-inducing factor)